MSGQSSLFRRKELRCWATPNVRNPYCLKRIYAKFASRDLDSLRTREEYYAACHG